MKYLQWFILGMIVMIAWRLWGNSTMQTLAPAPTPNQSGQAPITPEAVGYNPAETWQMMMSVN